MNFLITGGDGFIGSNLIPKLLNGKNHITVVSKSNYNLKIQSEFYRYIQGDYNDENLLLDELKEIDCIIHLAYTSVPASSIYDPAHEIKSNVSSTLLLLFLANKMGVKRFIFISSGGVVYGNTQKLPISEVEKLNPISSYGITKVIIELYIQLLSEKYNISYCILRVANAYGPGQHSRKNQGVINIWKNKIMNNEEVEVVNDGNIVRDYIHIDDVVDAFIKAIEMNVEGTYNIGTGIGTSLLDLIKTLEITLNLNAKVKFVNKRAYDVDANILNCNKFMELTQWKPNISLRDGIKKLT